VHGNLSYPTFLTPRRALRLAAAVVIALTLAYSYWTWTRPLVPDAADVERAYATPVTVPKGPLQVFHLGHSLVGRDMPAMLAQLAPPGHDYRSQLGWGTSKKEHWEPDLPINGFDVENDHPKYRDAKQAIGSGEYGAVVLTEMVEIRDAIKYYDSGKYLNQWATLARDAAPHTQVYLYETWHNLNDPEGWLERLDIDLLRYWEDRILLHDIAISGPDRPVHIIPAGQVMAHFVRAVEARGGVDNIRTREDLFARTPTGELDPIHINDLGAYLVALTHYAVLYHRSPVGLPYQLTRADGTPAIAPGPQVALLMQDSVWQVVTNYAKTGVAP
jgi:hypothetical protein